MQWINNHKNKILFVFSSITRLIFLLTLSYCLWYYPPITAVIIVLGYFIMSLEERIDKLEKQIKEMEQENEDNNIQRYTAKL